MASIKYKNTNTLQFIRYSSPELLIEGKPTVYIEKACDAWSIGILIYKLLFKKFPFEDSNNEKTLMENIFNFELEINMKIDVSELCVDVIKGLLNKVYSERLDLESSLFNDWLNHK
jgi:serine/threonine-protein kinase SRK2